MIIELRLDRDRPRGWMRRLATQLAGGDVAVQVNWAATPAPGPAGLESLFALERMILRKGAAGGADPIHRDAVATRLAGEPDVVIDFTDMPRDASRRPRQYLRPLYDGGAGEDAALAAILSGDLPVITIRDEISGAIFDRAVPSAETAYGLSGALDTVMARTTTLLTAIVSGQPRPALRALPAAGNRLPRLPAAYVLRGLAENIARRIYRLCCYAPHWRVGWRFTDDAGVWRSGDLSGAAWQSLPSPAHRFYADPFAVTWQGRTFAFFEDLDHRTNKGIIAAIEFDDRGPTGAVMPVLEEPWHLSYPFLIEDGGELWMIPESTGNNDVAIYRCVDFPLRWERHATLLSGLELADATIVRHDDRTYMFGASRDGAGGYSDTLSIYHADSLLGLWLPHERNPVLVDRASARPAGHFTTIDGKLWRPVQDCTHGYGAALALAEITELSPANFSQTVRHVVRPGPLWPGRKLHTLNRCGRLELIDGTSIQPRLAGLWQGG
jgi:hypothetical protein